MREIKSDVVTEAVRRMCIAANCDLPGDVRKRIKECSSNEEWPPARETLEGIIENYELASLESIPVCQDTGVALVFVEIGQDVYVSGDLCEAINEGVRCGYRDGYLRASIVADPLRRINTRDNTPAMIYYDIVPGDCFNVTVAPKGFGSENMSRLTMLPPSAGIRGITEFVINSVEEAGANACPPLVVGVGLGGTFDKVALLAKKALLRELCDVHPDEFYADMEFELLERINKLGIGPQAFGGRTTALAVKIAAMPTHIAGLPVAVNFNCHVARHVTERL